MVNGSTFRVLSADVAPVLGLIPSFVCYDELGQAPNRELVRCAGHSAGRPSATADAGDLDAGRDAMMRPCPSSSTTACALSAAKSRTPGFHLTLYTAPPEADPWKYATWKLANPALGDFRSLEDVKRLALLGAAHAQLCNELPQLHSQSARGHVAHRS